MHYCILFPFLVYLDIGSYKLLDMIFSEYLMLVSTFPPSPEGVPMNRDILIVHKEEASKHR